MARFILDVKTQNGDDFVAVVRTLKELSFKNNEGNDLESRASLLSSGNHFEEDRALNVLTDGEIDAFNRICGIESEFMK